MTDEAEILEAVRCSRGELHCPYCENTHFHMSGRIEDGLRRCAACGRIWRMPRAKIVDIPPRKDRYLAASDLDTLSVAPWASAEDTRRRRAMADWLRSVRDKRDIT